MAVDLTEVKKIIISLANLNPKGIFADQLNTDYQKREGMQIPFDQFGYSSLLVFLQHELQQNQQIKMVDEGFGSYVIYPIANARSGHVLEFTKNQLTAETKKKQYGRVTTSTQLRNAIGQCTNGQQNQKMNNASTSGQQSPSSTSTSAGNRSPTMPKLVPYRLIRKYPSRASDEQKIVSQRLLESYQAFVKRNNNGGNKKTPNNQPQSKPQQNDVMQQRSRNSILQQMNGQKTNRQQDTTSSTSASTQPVASVSGLQKTVTPNSTSQEPTIDHINDVWDDEWENIQPPTKNPQSRASSSFYGVSDIDGSTSTKSSHALLCQQMQLPSSDDEQEQEQTQTDLKALLDELHVGETVSVRISDVNNPLKFWLHLRPEKYVSQLRQMHNEMQEFYNANKNAAELKVEDSDVEAGVYFAACCAREWYRVDIYDPTRMGESVVVSFIDYGARETINISQMRRLVKQFRTTPKMAVCCALGNIKPHGKAFTGSNAAKFLELVDGEKMFANILHIDTNKSKATVELILESNKKCVNEELIKLGHGVAKIIKRQFA